MCKAPANLPNGVTVACRECSQCRDQKINDWVGRCIAESKTAKACHAVTLTYGRGKANDVDHVRARLLTYSDVQKYFKLLRRHGFPMRYIVAGEYGTKKGRAHWHVVLFWQDKVPEHVLDQNFMEAHWPHGWSHWTTPNPKAFWYNCKYIQKDMGEAQRQGHLAMSKNPPLGNDYLMQLAEKYVHQGVAPQSLKYSFPESRVTLPDGTDTPWEYYMKGKTAQNFLDHFLRKWREVHGDRWVPSSMLVDEHLDPGAWKERAEALKPWVDPPAKLDTLKRRGARNLEEWWMDMAERDEAEHVLNPWEHDRIMRQRHGEA